MIRILIGLEVGGTSLWTGASAGFAFVSAPLAFGIITDRDQFATLTGRSLARLARLSYIAGGIAIVAAGVRGSAVRTALGAAALGALAYHERTIVPAMGAVQQELGSFNDVAADHPKRLEYARMHKQSTRVFGAALLLGVAQLVLAALPPAPKAA
ncbi:MAG: hypothetical protein NVSMB5_24920 [Candidatus Velthaea sp.]